MLEVELVVIEGSLVVVLAVVGVVLVVVVEVQYRCSFSEFQVSWINLVNFDTLVKTFGSKFWVQIFFSGYDKNSLIFGNPDVTPV